jgi:hypothetical protein
LFTPVFELDTIRIQVRKLPLQQALLAIFSFWFLAWAFIYPEDGGEIFFRNVGVNFKGLHDVIYQTIELFTTTAVRTSYPT